MKNLSGKFAVITGGSTGIGYATAKKFVEDGATVVITGRNEKLLKEVSNELGCHFVIADQGKVVEIEALAAAVGKLTTKVDVLVLNAGGGDVGSIGQITEEVFDRNIDINFKGVFFTLQNFLPRLKEGSQVIFMSAVIAQTGMPNNAVYGSLKAAINTLAQSATSELAPLGIRVNTVSPGPISTAIWSKVGLPADVAPQFFEAIQNRIPLKRLGRPEEVANLVAFLASDQSTFINGANYLIDGGILINPVVG